MAPLSDDRDAVSSMTPEGCSSGHDITLSDSSGEVRGEMPAERAEGPSTKKKPRVLGKWFTVAAVVAILLVAFGLRFYGNNWDDGHLFHPDERAILMNVQGTISLPWPPSFSKLADAESSPLNPKWFPYGSFPLYSLKLLSHVASTVSTSLSGSDMRLVGRMISTLCDLGTVFLVFLMGRRLRGRTVGLLGAAFAALTVLAIQQAHFFVVDPVMTMLISLSAYAAMRVAAGGRRSMVLLGVAFGLAMASKVSAAPFAAAIALACLMGCWKDGGFRSDRLVSQLSLGVLAALIAAVVFFISAPYELLDFKLFWQQISEQNDMVNRVSDLPYTRQYIDTPAYWYQIEQMLRWGMGWPLGIAGWLGLVYASFKSVRHWMREGLVLVAWVWLYFLIDGHYQVKFLRYMLPVLPFLALFGAWMLVDLANAFRARRQVWRTLAWIPAVLVLLCTLVYAVGYDHIYSEPHPAVQVSEWIQKNVPKGALISKEHWEEGLPDLDGYRSQELPVYEDDTSAKLDTMANMLANSDYIVFYSNRLYATVSRLPMRYPMMREYYRQLFTGELGYELVTYAGSYPRVAGVTYIDDTFARPQLPRPAALNELFNDAINGGFADESFTVYDHPLVMLFKRQTAQPASFYKEHLASSLQNVAPVPGLPTSTGVLTAAVSTSVKTTNQQGLLLTDTERAQTQTAGTWSELFDRDSFVNAIPVIVWLLAIELLGILAFPLTAWLFGGLADAGYAFSKTLGLLIVVWIVWLFGALHIAAFERPSIIVAMVVLAIVSLGVNFRRKMSLRGLLKEHWRGMAVAEVLFLIAYFAFALVRAGNPDLWDASLGGEKPMDFAFLNAVVKSDYFPPYDPWFAGGFMNYYYYGQVVVATLIKLTGILPQIGFNLAVVALFALTISGAYAVVSSLLAVSQASRRVTVFGGCCGALFVAVIGNLDGLLQIAQMVGKAAPVQFASTLWEFPSGVWQILSGAQKLTGQFDFWRSSRMMSPTSAITEFPFFTFLFADLHAHLIAIPFALFTLGAVLAYLVTPRPMGKGRLVALMAIIALSLGSLRVINSWDFPTYLGITVVVALIAHLRHFSWSQRAISLALAKTVVFAVVVYVGTTLLFWPFHARYELFYNGVNPSPEKTLLNQYIGHNGFFLFAVLSFCLVLLVGGILGRNQRRFLGSWLKRWRRPMAFWGHYVGVRGAKAYLEALWPLALVFGGVMALDLLAIGQTFLACLVTILGLVLAAFVVAAVNNEPGRLPKLFVLGLSAVALCIGIGVDFITIQGDVDRMNTVFKFYLQAWVFLAIASAYAFAYMVPRAFALIRRHRCGRPVASVWLVLAAFLVVGVLVYPVMAPAVRDARRFNALPLTLDGMAYMDQAVYRDDNRLIKIADDRDAINWMLDNVKGTPTILEGNSPLYRWGSRFSVYTGLPTVIGWDWHEIQQRMGYQSMVSQRLEDVKTAYSTTEPSKALSILRKYNVRYVIIGQLESYYYPAAGLAKFEKMSELSVVYRNDSVTIYEVAGGSS